MGNRSWNKLSILALTIGMGLIVAISSILYYIYEEQGFSLQFASTLSSLTLVIITMWYAQSTYKLLDQTKSQTKATRAAYAPKLDVTSKWGEDHLELKICNRGLGVAKDIDILFDVFTGRMGVMGAGERYRYICHFRQSLTPNSKLTDEGSDSLTIKPEFFLETSEETIKEQVSRLEHGAPPNFLNPDTLNYLVEHFETEGDGGAESFPTESGDLFDLAEYVRTGDGEGQALLISVTAEYRDVIGSDVYSEELVNQHTLRLDLTEYEDGIRPTSLPPTASGFRLKFARYFIRKGKQKLSPEYVTYPFEEDCDGVVEDL